MDSRKKADVETFSELTSGGHQFYLWPPMKPGRTYGDVAASAASNAQEATCAMAPWVTVTGIQMLTAKGDYAGPLLNIIGVPFTIGGVVIDAVKLPICAAIATEEAVRAGISKLASLVLDQDPNEEEMKEIFNSFLLRMRETANILIALKLADVDVLNCKLASGDIEDLVALTLLNTAYQSRDCAGGLLLAAKKTLSPDDCPPRGRPLFDKVMELKEAIQSALSSSEYKSDAEREYKDAETVCSWIKDIVAGKPLSMADKPDATRHQLLVVNKIIAEIASMKALAMAALPVTPQSAANSVPGFTRR